MLFSFLWQLSTQGAKRELLLTDRPYLPLNIQALEELFENNDNDLKVLNLLLQELQHRKTARARQLNDSIQSRVSELSTAKPPSDPNESTPFPTENAPPIDTMNLSPEHVRLQ